LDGVSQRFELLDQNPSLSLAIDLGEEADPQEAIPVWDLLKEVEPFKRLDPSVDQQILN
jgi:hypothetical protein